MSNIAIRAEKLGKRFRVGERLRYLALRDVLTQSARAPWRLLRGAARPHASNGAGHIWALKDASFEVREGEVVGVIGRNGAGKSTLLKILARVTKPTEGFAKIHGRLGSLLEVGTGFHSELTGRENVYLSGAILGMKKREVVRKFDEIVTFAEVEEFIDTPLKHFSTGMQMRLAFAVAAHLEPEILLVDEVLAVGDVAFQKKCLGKMGDVAHGGRTILFVSHQMGAITHLCRRAIWLERGHIRLAGDVEKVVAAYLSTGEDAEGEKRWEPITAAPGNAKMRLRALRVVDAAERVTSQVDIRQRFAIEIEYAILQPLQSLRTAFRLISADGTIVFSSADTHDSSWDGVPRSQGLYTSRCEIPGHFLNEGRYTLAVTADTPFVETFFYEDNALGFFVEQTGGISGRYPERWPGVICPKLDWGIERKGST